MKTMKASQKPVLTDRRLLRVRWQPVPKWGAFTVEIPIMSIRESVAVAIIILTLVVAIMAVRYALTYPATSCQRSGAVTAVAGLPPAR